MTVLFGKNIVCVRTGQKCHVFRNWNNYFALNILLKMHVTGSICQYGLLCKAVSTHHWNKLSTLHFLFLLKETRRSHSSFSTKWSVLQQNMICSLFAATQTAKLLMQPFGVRNLLGHRTRPHASLRVADILKDVGTENKKKKKRATIHRKRLWAWFSVAAVST